MTNFTKIVGCSAKCFVEAITQLTKIGGPAKYFFVAKIKKKI